MHNNLSFFFWMLLLVTLQLLIFSHMALWGYITPLPFIFLLAIIPLGYPRWGLMLWGFFCGLLCDIIMFTPGVGAAAMTLVAFLQPSIIKKLKQNLEEETKFLPSISSMGSLRYHSYIIIITNIFFFTYYLLQYITFARFIDWFLSLLLSWLTTILLCLVFEKLHQKIL